MFTRKGQSILEYSILLAVVIAVLLIMQAFIKRGYQGSLKTSADKMGEQFSANSTTIKEKQEMTGNQDVVTEVGTNAAVMGQFSSVMPTGVTVKGTLDQGVPAYSLNTRIGGVVAATTEQKTSSASQEKARLADYQTDTVTNFTDPDLPQ
jgi:hypothetical protein